MNWRNLPKSPETREKMRRASLVALSGPHVRGILKQKAIDSWRDPDIRARRCAGLREAWKRRLAEQVTA